MRRVTLSLLAVALIACSIGCKKPSDKPENSTEIVIGEYASLSGGTADFGNSSHNGLMLAIDRINKEGGVLGKKIKVITEDDQSNAEQATNVVTKLITQDNVVAIIGEVASKRSLSGAPICQKKGIPMLSPASTNPEVTKVGDDIFRICFTDDFQGPTNARFALKKGWKRVAILTDFAQDYSIGLTDSFKARFTKGGGEIVATEKYKDDTNDFQTVLTNLKNAHPDAVFLPGYYDAVQLVLPQARKIGFDVPFFGGDGWDSPQTLKLGSAADHCFFSTHYSADDTRPATVEFVKAYRERFGSTPDAMAVLGYDAGGVMADAIRRAGKVNSAAIRDALAATKDYHGASGDITINKDRNADKPIVIVEIQDGKTKLADTIPPEGN